MGRRRLVLPSGMLTCVTAVRALPGLQGLGLGRGGLCQGADDHGRRLRHVQVRLCRATAPAGPAATSFCVCRLSACDVFPSP